MKRKIIFIFLIVILLFILAGLFSKKKPQSDYSVVPQAIDAKSRSFYLGFTSFPPAYSQDGIDRMNQFVKQNADMVAHHFDAGIPWVEAYNNDDFSKNLKDNWEGKRDGTPNNFPVYVAITPLNSARSGLANYWGEKDNMSLPVDWANYRLNDEHVKTAYLNYAKRVVDYFHPKYLAIGIESNLLINNQSMWPDYLELNHYVYTELKKSYPDLLVFDTIQLEHMKGLIAGEKPATQLAGVKELMRDSDVIALSTYHFGSNNNPITKKLF